MITCLKRVIKKWVGAEDAVAAVEAALVFPILMTLLLGTFDMGNAILANQKTIRASQVAGDLITRERTISSAGIDEAVEAGELAFAPLDASSFGVDIVSLRFNDDAEPEIVWRETRNMSPNPDVLDSVASLAEAGNGVVVVTVQYLFEPIFSGFVTGEIPMQEISFTRGRKSAVVNLE
ncbi:MAG: pilus assembly protein [Alphaproteobacteria bacterium]|nr:pilus assembly protein [Alphaproteobacteria bacterium]